MKNRIYPKSQVIRFRPEVQQKALFPERIQSLLSENLEVWHQSVAVKYPYKLARLIHHRYNLKKRWYILFYAWDLSTNKLKRYRMFDPLNRIKNKQQRIEQAEQAILIINAQLRAGKVFNRDQVGTISTTINPAKLTLLKAIDFVKDQKEANGHRNNYVRSFLTLKSNLEAWLENKKQPDFPLKQFDEKDAREFFSYLRDKRKQSNKTINGVIRNLGIAFRFIEKTSDSQVWRKDPLRNVEALPVVAKMHPAYSDDQIELIKKEITKSILTLAKHRKPGYRQLQMFISFIYYLFARPNELIGLKISDIDIKQNRIFIRGEVSKNKMDDMVEIPPQLKKIIEDSGILDYPGEYYIFGKSGVPDTVPVGENFFWAKHKRVLKNTGLRRVNENFSLYGYKHSGVVSLYKATKDIKLVQAQCRHQTLEQTNAYLRDLGALSDYDKLKNYTGAV